MHSISVHLCWNADVYQPAVVLGFVYDFEDANGLVCTGISRIYINAYFVIISAIYLRVQFTCRAFKMLILTALEGKPNIKTNFDAISLDQADHFAIAR